MSTMMDNKTEERLSTTDNGDHDRFAHYVRKSDLDAAILYGEPITALCGKRWLPSGDFTKFPTCPECKEKWEKMEPGDNDEE